MSLKKKFKQSAVACSKLLRWVPDSLFLRVVYFIKLHRLPDLKNPKRFTEWMQWYKIHGRNEEMPQCTDKYLVRNFVSKRGCDKYLIDLYQVCDSADEIDYSKLPSSFVIKTTDGGNGDNVFICPDKSKINIEEVNQKVNSWRNKHYEQYSREWAYSGAVSSKIIVERYLEDPSNADGSIDDYKFLCFNGEFKVLWIDKDRYSKHKRGFWNKDLKFMEGVRSDHPTFDNPPELPANIDEMVKLAETLSAGFEFARVDLYNIKGEIIFGEITFYPWSGFVQYYPDSFDFELGSFFNKK